VGVGLRAVCRPHDRVTIREMKQDWQSCLDSPVGFRYAAGAPPVCPLDRPWLGSPVWSFRIALARSTAPCLHLIFLQEKKKIMGTLRSFTSGKAEYSPLGLMLPTCDVLLTTTYI